MPGDGGWAAGPPGQGGEHINGGFVRDHGVERQKIPVHEDGGQVVERVLGQAAAENLEAKTRMLCGETMEDLAKREAAFPVHGHGALSDPVPERTREPERRFRHGHSGWFRIGWKSSGKAARRPTGARRRHHRIRQAVGKELVERRHSETA